MTSMEAMLVFVHILVIFQKRGDIYYFLKCYDYMRGQGNWSIVSRQTHGAAPEYRSDLFAFQWGRNLTAIKGRPIKYGK